MGGLLGGVAAAMATTFVILYKDRDEFLTMPQTLALGAAIAFAAALGDLFESAAGRDLAVKDSRLLGGHVECSTASTRSCGRPAAFYVILSFGHA